MSLDLHCSELLWYFCIYSFLGWILEVIYHAVTTGRVVNRGFLDGPVCPIYGFGALAVVSLSDLAASVRPDFVNPPLVFLVGMVLATAIELFAGWLLDRLFHTQWWDYSDKPLHFHGYICLEFSLLWGVMSVFAIFILHPFVRMMTPSFLPLPATRLFLGALYLIFAADVFTTVVDIRRFSSELKELEDFQDSLHGISDHLSEVIGTGALKTQQKIDEQHVQAALASAELENRMNEKIEALKKRLSRSKICGTGRRLRAFPHLHSRLYPKTLTLLRDLFE
jgi:hypothetical protein